MYYVNHYVINWDEVKTFDDMKRIMKVMNITFEPYQEGIDTIKDLVKEVPKNTNTETCD